MPGSVLRGDVVTDLKLTSMIFCEKKKKKRLEVLMVAVFVNVSSPVLNLRHDHHDMLSLSFLTLF